MKKNVIITILVILVLSLGGYLVYNRVIDNNSKKNTIDELENKNKQYDLVEAKKIVDKYMLDFLFWEGVLEDNLSEEDKIFLAIKYTNSTKINYSCKEAFPEGTTNEYGQFIVGKGDFSSLCYEGDSALTHSQYTYDSVNKTYKELFGDKKELPKQMIFLNYRIYAYSEKYDAYIELSCECGGAPYQSSYYDIKSANEINDNLEVVINYVDFDFNDYSKKFYANNNIDISISVDDPHDVTLDQMKELYNRALRSDEIRTYRFIFNKNNTGYYLESIKKDIY